MMAATYAVKPGDSMTRQYPFAMFADESYAIEVHGPNGFYRSFTGRADSLLSRSANVLRAELAKIYRETCSCVCATEPPRLSA